MRRRTAGPVVYYQLDCLADHAGVAHGIFTRLGGRSLPPWKSLNTGHGVGDDPDAVDANHRLICDALDVSTDQLVSPHQVHGIRVATVDARDCGTVVEATDGLITDAPGVVLMLRYADCVPIWFLDASRQVVGLAHAGWRGTVAGMAKAVLRAMQEAYGCRPGDVVSGIGPSIGPCCYEVGEEVAHAAVRAFGAAARQWFAPGPAGRPHLDLWAANRAQLRDAGVGAVEVSGLCTACHVDEWYSHRAERGKTGRMGALIGLRR